MKSFSTLFAMLLWSASAALAAAAPDARPQIEISRTVPVVGNEVIFRVNAGGGTDIPSRAVFTIEREGKELLRQEVMATDGRFAQTWTPADLGFYTASFDFGAQAGIGKVSHPFPVVWRELYFTVWGVLWPEQVPRLKYIISHAAISGDIHRPPFDQTIPMLRARGSRLLVVTSGTTAIPDGPVTDEQVDRLVEGWSRPVKDGFDGIMMDEMGEYPVPERLAVVEGVSKALAKLRKECPDMLIMPWVGGQLSREEASGFRSAGCMIMLETYPNMFTRVWGAGDAKAYIDVRVRNARANDLLWQYSRRAGSIITLGLNVDGAYEEPVLPEAEEFVRYIKKTAPEMPGIGFYGLPRAAGPSIEVLDRLCLDYFIKPVVDIRQIHFSNFSPAAAQPMDILVGLNNVGGMDARDIKLSVYATEVATGARNLVGEVNIEKIGCGVRTLHKQAKDNFDKIEYQQVNGNNYMVFANETPVYLGRTTAKVTWKPPRSGSYSILAVVQASAQFTTLDGVAERYVTVR